MISSLESLNSDCCDAISSFLIIDEMMRLLMTGSIIVIQKMKHGNCLRKVDFNLDTFSCVKWPILSSIIIDRVQDMSVSHRGIHNVEEPSNIVESLPKRLKKLVLKGGYTSTAVVAYLNMNNGGGILGNLETLHLEGYKHLRNEHPLSHQGPHIWPLSLTDLKIDLSFTRLSELPPLLTRLDIILSNMSSWQMTCMPKSLTDCSVNFFIYPDHDDLLEFLPSGITRLNTFIGGRNKNGVEDNLEVCNRSELLPRNLVHSQLFLRRDTWHSSSFVSCLPPSLETLQVVFTNSSEYPKVESVSLLNLPSKVTSLSFRSGDQMWNGDADVSTYSGSIQCPLRISNLKFSNVDFVPMTMIDLTLNLSWRSTFDLPPGLTRLRVYFHGLNAENVFKSVAKLNNLNTFEFLFETLSVRSRIFDHDLVHLIPRNLSSLTLRALFRDSARVLSNLPPSLTELLLMRAFAPSLQENKEKFKNMQVLSIGTLCFDADKPESFSDVISDSVTHLEIDRMKYDDASENVSGYVSCLSRMFPGVEYLSMDDFVSTYGGQYYETKKTLIKMMMSLPSKIKVLQLGCDERIVIDEEIARSMPRTLRSIGLENTDLCDEAKKFLPRSLERIYHGHGWSYALTKFEFIEFPVPIQ